MEGQGGWPYSTGAARQSHPETLSMDFWDSAPIFHTLIIDPVMPAAWDEAAAKPHSWAQNSKSKLPESAARASRRKTH